MARVVGGVSVPHNPFLPVKVKDDPDGINARNFAAVAEAIDELDPDIVIAFSPDHLNTVFFDNLPTLLIGIVDEFSGPDDDYPPVAPQTFSSDPELARHIFHHALRSDFDLSRSESLTVDHSLLVPLQIMEFHPVVVPIIMNVLAPPVMNATRAHALGRVVAESISTYPRDFDVLVLADGGVIQEVAGPRINPGKPDGAPDQEWLARVIELLREGNVDELLAEATPRKIAEAGNAAGELLTAIAMLGALGPNPGRPKLIEAEPDTGHMFAFWESR
jgi:2,3-dihydroxyphenylpropionate 1,2-dioxygenase